MKNLVFYVCIPSILLFLFVVIWYVCSHRYRMKKRLKHSLVMTECFDPHLVCKSVPRQHPYYRVLAEYSGKSYNPKLNFEKDDDAFLSEDVTKPPSPPSPEYEGHRKFSYAEWCRRLSIGGIPRRNSMNTHPYRKISSSSSRRSSDANSSSGFPMSPVYRTKPTFLPEKNPTVF